MEPRIALIGSNTLMIEGLRQMLEEVMPFAIIDQFRDIQECLRHLSINNPHKSYYHYFVSTSAIPAESPYYSPAGDGMMPLAGGLREAEHSRVIWLIDTENYKEQEGTLSLNMLQPRKDILRQLLALQDKGHHDYARYPEAMAEEMRHTAQREESLLTRREKEVLRLLARGMINKEIADKLHISVNTAITHRKHIMQKLHSQSLSKLVVYAVQHRLIDPSEVR